MPTFPAQPSRVMRKLAPGERVFDYEIQRLIGGGTFSQVYLVVDTSDVRRPLRALLALSLQGDSQEMELRRRTFKRTAEVLERLSHPAIPKIYKFFEDQSDLYLIEEFIDGTNCAEQLDGGTRLGVEEAERVFREVLAGLAELHRARIVHRDIKPANLMRRNQDGSIAIIDFGSAIDLTMTTAPGTTIGTQIGSEAGFTRIYTPGYAHPDQRDGLGTATFQWDLYSLATTIVALRLGTQMPWQQNWKLEELGFSEHLALMLQQMLQPRDCPYVDALDALGFYRTPTQQKPPVLQPPAEKAEPPVVRPEFPERERRPLPPARKAPGYWLAAGGLLGLGTIGTAGYFLLGPKPPVCPIYTASTLNLPAPDRGFAARFKYPKGSLASDASLEVLRGTKTIARAKAQIQGFIWLKGTVTGAAFPPGTYRLRLRVPGSLPYEQDVQLDSDFPAYIGEAQAIEPLCAVKT